MALSSSDSRTPLRAVLLLPIVALTLVLAACGGGERPNADQVAEGLQAVFDEMGAGDYFTETQVLCIAEKLVESELTDEDLQSIADGNSEASQSAAEVLSTVGAEATAACTTP